MPTITDTADITLHREYDAPLDTVWQAWADPEQIKEWWGPRGFSITTENKDLRTGGTWKYVMHGPDGVDYENFTTYLEVEKKKKLVYDHGATATTKALFRVTVLFSELPARGADKSKTKTKMDMTMTFPSVEAAQTSAGFIKKAGGNATWDRLGEFLEKKVKGKDVFVINQTFDAPIETVFKMWTDPEHLPHWLPPTGFAMKYKNCDLKEGGACSYSMSNGDVTMHGACQYSKIDRPNRIVYTQQFCDENGNISRHPMAPTWPENMLTVVDFCAETADTTRVTITWQPYGKFTDEELQTTIAARAGMTQGWTGSFDKLEKYLSNHVSEHLPENLPDIR
jgi:uncharacterized protein YndB with AHSA1/START domain